MREVKRRYWDEDLSHFGEQFAEKGGGYVHGEPGMSTEDEFFSSIEPEPANLMPEVFLAMERLTPKQRFVIECRYGFRNEGKQMNVDQIADLMNISQPAVSKLLRKGLRNLEREVSNLRGGYGE